MTDPAHQSRGLRALFFLPGTFAPGAVALFLSAGARRRGRSADLLDALFVWQVPARWYVFAAGFMFLPLFFIAGTDTTGQPFTVYFLSVTALSVAMTWLYVNTRGSLLLVMLMHAAVNNTTIIVPAALPDASHPLALRASLMAWLTAAVLWGAAMYFLMRMSPALRNRGSSSSGEGQWLPQQKSEGRSSNARLPGTGYPGAQN